MSLLPSGIWAALAPGPQGLQMLRRSCVCLCVWMSAFLCVYVCVCVFSVLISSACLLKLAPWDEMCCMAALPEISAQQSELLCQSLTRTTLIRQLFPPFTRGPALFFFPFFFFKARSQHFQAI